LITFEDEQLSLIVRSWVTIASISAIWSVRSRS